jgi:hypothetical protein
VALAGARQPVAAVAQGNAGRPKERVEIVRPAAQFCVEAMRRALPHLYMEVPAEGEPPAVTGERNSGAAPPAVVVVEPHRSFLGRVKVVASYLVIFFSYALSAGHDAPAVR